MREGSLLIRESLHGGTTKVFIYLGFVSHPNVNVARNRGEYKTTRQHDGPDLQLCVQRQSARLPNLPNCFLLCGLAGENTLRGEKKQRSGWNIVWRDSCLAGESYGEMF